MPRGSTGSQHNPIFALRNLLQNLSKKKRESRPGGTTGTQYFLELAGVSMLAGRQTWWSEQRLGPVEQNGASGSTHSIIICKI